MPSNIKNILNEYVEGLNKIVGEHLKQVILYGSYARGEQDKNGEISDIDILILVDTEIKEIKKLEKKIIEYSYEINLKYNVLISPMIENNENYNKKANYMLIYKNIEKEGVLLNE